MARRWEVGKSGRYETARRQATARSYETGKLGSENARRQETRVGRQNTARMWEERKVSTREKDKDRNQKKESG